MKLEPTIAKLVAVGAMIGTACPVLAQGQGKGRGTGGGPGEETTSNNLSVPTIFVSGDTVDFQAQFKLPFAIGESVSPESASTEAPYTGFPVSGHYYVQGVHQWQAETVVGESGLAVTAAWGDNLIGDAKLKTGSPIRVEVGLLAMLADDTMTGWDVIKLEPDLLDRLAFYGTLADSTTGASYPDDYSVVRVYDADGWLKVYKVGDPDHPIVDEAASAEVNSTGRIVYGYNLRVVEQGSYVLWFSFPNVTISGSNGGTFTTNTVSLTIDVVPGGGKKGGRVVKVKKVTPGKGKAVGPRRAKRK